MMVTKLFRGAFFLGSVVYLFVGMHFLSAESDPYIPQEVYFSYRSHKIPEVAIDNLLELANYLQKRPGIQIFIKGYAKDGLGYKGDMDLSHRRADSVKRFLMVHGIEPSRILSYGLGSDEARTDVLESKRARRFHRRVVIGFELK